MANYATVPNLRGKDRDIHYRILSLGGSGWEWDMSFCYPEDRDEFLAEGLTDDEREQVNKAINLTEGNTY